VDDESGHPLPYGLLPMARVGLHLRRQRIRRSSWTHGEIRWRSWIRRCSCTHGTSAPGGARCGHPGPSPPTPAARLHPPLLPRRDAHLVMASWRAGLPSPPSRWTATMPVVPSSPSTAGATCPGVAVLGVVACLGGDPGGGGDLVVNPTAAAWWWARRWWLSAFFVF
jgi:hypothetical protein